jgi:hypothetical protein
VGLRAVLDTEAKGKIRIQISPLWTANRCYHLAAVRSLKEIHAGHRKEKEKWQEIKIRKTFPADFQRAFPFV